MLTQCQWKGKIQDADGLCKSQCPKQDRYKRKLLKEFYGEWNDGMNHKKGCYV